MTIIKLKAPKKQTAIAAAVAAKKTKTRPTEGMNPLERAVAQSADATEMLNLNWSQVTRVIGDVANGNSTDAVIYFGEAELKMRRIIAMFGFPRLPLTWGEINGVLDYCEGLSNAAGDGYPADCVEMFQIASRRVLVRIQPELVPALDAYVAGNTAALLAIHTREKTIEQLGRGWREYQFPEGHPLFGIENEEMQK